jgi:hypothetical protein
MMDLLRICFILRATVIVSTAQARRGAPVLIASLPHNHNHNHFEVIEVEVKQQRTRLVTVHEVFRCENVTSHRWLQ